MSEVTLAVFIAAVFLLAGGVKGVLGLGLPTVGMGLLSIVMTPAQAAGILVIPALVTNIWQVAWAARKSLSCQRTPKLPTPFLSNSRNAILTFDLLRACLLTSTLSSRHPFVPPARSSSH